MDNPNPHPLSKYVSEAFQGSLIKQTGSRTRNRPARENIRQIVMGYRVFKIINEQSGELTIIHQNTVAEKISNYIQKGRPIFSNARQTEIEDFFDPILENLPIAVNKRWSPICKRDRFIIATLKDYLQPFGPNETVPTLLTFKGPVPELPGEKFPKSNRWYLEIDPLHLADSYFNVDFAVVPGIAKMTSLTSPADFIEVIANPTDPSFEKVEYLLDLLVNGALAHLVPANSSIRMIELEETPNFLLLQSVKRFLSHCLNASPQLEADRADRANVLKKEGITRENFYPVIKNFLVSWGFRKAPSQINFSLLGVESVHVLPMCSTVKAQLFSGNQNQAVTSNSPKLKRLFWNNIWQSIEDCLLILKKFLENKFQTSSENIQSPDSIWRMVSRREPINYESYQSLFDPYTYMNEKLLPVLEQYFNIRNRKGNLNLYPKLKDRKELDELVEIINRDAEKYKKDAERFYPDERKKWDSLREFYTTCYEELQLAHSDAVTSVEEEEKSFQSKHGKEMPQNKKEAFRKRTENRLISRVKKDYPITIQIPRHMDPDNSDENYSQLYANSAIQRRYPSNFSKVSPFVLFVTLIIEKQNFTLKPNELLFHIMRFLSISSSPSPWDNIKEVSE